MVALWGYAFMYKNGEVPLSCFGFEFKAREKLYVLVPASIIVGLVTGMLNALIYAAIIFALVTLPHMSFHAPASFDALTRRTRASDLWLLAVALYTTCQLKLEC